MGRPRVSASGKQTVDDFEGGAVSADRQEIADPLAVGLARDFGGFAGSSCVLYGQSNSDIADFF